MILSTIFPIHSNQFYLAHQQDKFNIIPGHHGGFISNIVIDPTSRFMFTTSGNRGVLNNQNYSTDLTFVYNIDNQ